MTSNYLLPTRRVTACAGLSQLINWGISFYMPGTFSSAVAAQTGWSSTFIYGGLTLAMLMMAAVSPFVARFLSLFGGQQVLIIGTLFITAGCITLALPASKITWLVAWSIIGIGMRLSLYDTLFSVLVGLYGPASGRVISKVALFGGMASVVFWPLGTWLLTHLSWHAVVLIYACTGLMNAGLLLVVPNQKSLMRKKIQHAAKTPANPLPATLYALFIALMTFVSNGTSTHMPELIASCGLPVTVGMLWGIGQTGSRLLDVLSGSRLTPVQLAIITSALIPLCFLLALTGTHFACAIAGFILGYGAVNGLMTVVKATLPLQLFSLEHYAERTGILLIPAQLLAAISPFFWAWLNSHVGIKGTLWCSLLLGLAIASLAILLANLIRTQQQFSEQQSSI
ncbi:MAG TPA: MFS transporter [Scandinavium sp.]|jgi:MFS family permease|uniref:MFS transporter n=1 Tax=Scandinavium sp. TaxID=2830653 RepID=UPI002E33032D|nr:MFS transporter [Scandinavium sp.]HEX4502034.1 MFS transporter [Scandinavium sp.]